MARQPTSPEPADPPLPDDVASQLHVRGVTALGESELRRELERHAPSYTLVRLTPAAAGKWKARYRIMLAADYLDCQSVAEAYARALLASLASPGDADATPPANPTGA